VEGVEAGTLIEAKHVPLPRVVELLTDPEALVVNVTQRFSAEAVEAELAEAEAEAGIEHEEAAPAEGEAEAAAPAEGEGEGEQAAPAEGEQA
jgi:large subunit ribosomal protein L25